MGSLPLPPSIVAPQLSAPGPFQGYNQPPFGQTSPYASSTAANLLQGINSFVEQFQKAKERDRVQSANMAQQGLQNLMLGLPVDLKKLAKHMKAAGMEIDFENTMTPGAPSSVAQHGGQETGVPGSSVPQRTAMPGVAPTVQPASSHSSQLPQQVGGGFWERVKDAYLGRGGEINPQSPGIAALQAMGQRGMQRQALEDKAARVQSGAMDLQLSGQPIEAQKQAVFSAALNGNRQAAETAVRSGMMKEIGGDEIFRIGRAAGMTDEQIAARVLGMQAMGQQTDMLKMMMNLAEKWAPHFGNDLSKATKYVQDIFTKGQSDLVPEGMDLDERIKVDQLAIDIQKQHPSMPLNLARAYSMASSKGDTKTASAIMSAISKFPTAGDVDWKKWSAGMDLDLKKFQQAMSQFNKEFELNTFNAVRGELGKEFDDAFAVLSNKNSTDTAKNTALTMMSEALNKKNQIKVKLPGSGQEVSLGMGVKLTDPSFFDKLLSYAPFVSSDRRNPQMVPSSSPEDVSAALRGATAPPPSVDPTAWKKAWAAYLEKMNFSLGQTTTQMGPD